MILLDHTLPDGHRICVARTCCRWDMPDANGASQRHGMHVGGYKPWWLRIDDGDWLHLPEQHGHSIMQELSIFLGAAESMDEFFTAVGVVPLTTEAATLPAGSTPGPAP